MGRNTGLVSLGTRLRALRAERGFTQEELARAMDGQLRALQEWEQDRRQPGLFAGQQLALALGVTVAQLLAGVDPRLKAARVRRGRPPRPRPLPCP